MKKTITVRGTGKVSASPDKVIFKMTLKTSHADYRKCMKLADTRSDLLKSALMKKNFSEEDIKTADFNIKQDYHWGKNNIKIIDEWYCSHVLKVEFPFDIVHLREILDAVTSCGIQFEISLDFTVEDSEALEEKMLENAAKDARKKAELLCIASGAKLGELLSINYSWGEINIISHTEYEGEFDDCLPPGAAPGIVPEEIKVKDSATFIWAIE